MVAVNSLGTLRLRSVLKMRLRNPCSKAALSAATVTLTLIFLLLLVGAAASLGDDKHVEDDETCDEGIDPATEGDSDSSIVDFIDPSILEDDELLDDIRSQLVKGKLVVIRNAFRVRSCKEFDEKNITSLHLTTF